MRLPAGYASRPANEDDLDAIVDVSAASDRVDVGFEDPARDLVRDLWRRRGFDLERHTAVVVADRDLVAYAELFGSNPERSLESFARVHPAHRGRGLGTAILSWFESMARELAPAGTPALRVHRAWEIFEKPLAAAYAGPLEGTGGGS